ncbi:MAG: hypothetical protein MZW92_19420 [Comamonadaceae bacterium]|nr:hypothetical protein [Comamonadaceae bacterium]
MRALAAWYAARVGAARRADARIDRGDGQGRAAARHRQGRDPRRAAAQGRAARRPKNAGR